MTIMTCLGAATKLTIQMITPQIVLDGSNPEVKLQGDGMLSALVQYASPRKHADSLRHL